LRIGLAAILGLVAAGGNLLGGYFVVRKEWPRGSCNIFWRWVRGYMLAVSLIDIIPESVRLADKVPFYMCLPDFS